MEDVKPAGIPATVPLGTPPPIEVKQEPKARPVMQEEFSAFKKEVNDGIGAIMGKLEKIVSVPPTIAEGSLLKAAPVIEAGPNKETPVPVNWAKAVLDILGPEFEVKFDQPDSGGAMFTIIVPKEKSNATVDHWKMYKRDYRSRELGNTGLAGVKEWALKVRQNLTASGIKLIQYP